MKKVLKALASYLRDWKNLLAHTLIGIAILAAALFIPVKPVYRILILAAVVTFNIIRMRVSKNKTAAEQQ